MPEWLIERGIGETRAALVEDGSIAEARIFLEGVRSAGTIVSARLKRSGGFAVATAGDQEFLLPKGAPGRTDGAALNIEITREAIGTEPWKRALARVTADEVRPSTAVTGREVRDTTLDEAGWLDLMEEARSGLVQFPGGELRIAVTSAMTLIDVDGHLPPAELAVAGARAAAATIRRHGVGGSIGIDFPTIEGKAARQSVDRAIDETIPKPFERTAINGFGFMQIVRARAHASLFELALDSPSFEARALIRRASREVGAIRLVAHPALTVIFERNPAWIDQLARQVGGAVTLRPDPAMPMSGGYAEPA